jgi:pilus assembly protein Flp/PilA
MLGHVKRLWTEQEGQGMAEYGLILALVAVLVIGALTALSGGISNNFNRVAEELNNPGGSGGGGS